MQGYNRREHSFGRAGKAFSFAVARALGLMKTVIESVRARKSENRSSREFLSEGDVSSLITGAIREVQKRARREGFFSLGPIIVWMALVGASPPV